MNAEASARVLFIGLDGATFSILDPLMLDGTMPFLAKFTAKGVRAVLHSTPHPLTPPAWTSMVTGRSPGEHGIFDFVRIDRRRDHPTYTLVTSADVRCETIWSIASRHQRRVISLNFPCMFPPPPLNGFVVPGYVPWTYLARAVHPADLYKRLKAQLALNARELATDWNLERQAVQGLQADELEMWVKSHIDKEQRWFEVGRLLMREEPSELTAILFDGADRIQHLCYHFIDPHLASYYPSPQDQHIRSLCLDYFRRLDGFLEELIGLAGAEALVFIASDHGFAAAGQQIFYANVWLQQQGYLAWGEGIPFDQAGRVALDDHAEVGKLFDWSGTVAYALTSASNGIFIRQRRADGEIGVPVDEYFAFRERLVQSLLAITDPKTDRPIIRQVLTREQAFPGKYMEQAPDLTLLLSDSSFLSVLRADAPLRQRCSPCGTHHPDGILLVGGPGIRPGETLAPVEILDVAPTLLYGLGIPVPSEAEGSPVVSAFEPSFLAARPVSQAASSVESESRRAQPQETSLGPDAEEQIMKRLRALGYL